MDNVKELLEYLGIPDNYYHTITFDLKKNEVLGWYLPLYGGGFCDVIGRIYNKTATGFQILGRLQDSTIPEVFRKAFGE